MKNNIFTFFVLSIVAASCSSQKYSRTANTVDDVYFVPGNEAFVFAEANVDDNSGDNNQGFSFDNSPTTVNPNSSNRDRYSYSNNTNEVQQTPSGFEGELFNESPRDINIYNNFNSFDPFWNPAFAMNRRMPRSMFWNYYAYNSFSPWYNPWNRPGFQISYSPSWGWNIGFNYGMPMWNNPWGMNNMMWGNPFYDPFCPWGGMYGNSWGWGGMQAPMNNVWNTNNNNRINSNFAPRRSGNSVNPVDNQGNSRRSETIYNQGGRGGTSITPGQSERKETVPQGNTNAGTRQEPNQNATPAGRNRYNYSNSPSQPSTAPSQRDNSPNYSAPSSRPSSTPSYSAPSSRPSSSPSYSAPSSRPSSTPSYSAPSSMPSSTPSYSAPSSRPSSTPSYSAPSSRPSNSPSTSPSRGGESGGSAPRRR